MADHNLSTLESPLTENTKVISVLQKIQSSLESGLLVDITDPNLNNGESIYSASVPVRVEFRGDDYVLYDNVVKITYGKTDLDGPYIIVQQENGEVFKLQGPTFPSSYFEIKKTFELAPEDLGLHSLTPFERKLLGMGKMEKFFDDTHMTGWLITFENGYQLLFIGVHSFSEGFGPQADVLVDLFRDHNRRHTLAAPALLYYSSAPFLQLSIKGLNPYTNTDSRYYKFDLLLENINLFC